MYPWAEAQPLLMQSQAAGAEWGNGFGSVTQTRTRDLMLRSRPRPATASAHQRDSIGEQLITASRRQRTPARLLLKTLLALKGGGISASRDNESWAGEWPNGTQPWEYRRLSSD